VKNRAGLRPYTRRCPWLAALVCLGCAADRPHQDDAEDAALDGSAGAGGAADAAGALDRALPDATSLADAALVDAALVDATLVDATLADAAPADAGAAACVVTIASEDGTVQGSCGVPDGPETCLVLAQCLCMVPTEPTGFGDCLQAIGMPRALVNLSDFCGSGTLSLTALIAEPAWRGTWDQGRYRLTASPGCAGITARL